MRDRFIIAASAVLGWLGMDKVRRDVVLVSFAQRRFKLGLCVLFLPDGYSLYAKHVDEASDAPCGNDAIGA